MSTGTLVLTCIGIFFGRLLDVPIGTLRTILVVKEKTLFAVICGFVESLVWFLIVKAAITTLEGGLVVGIFYAGGFAVGTFIGSIIARRFINTGVEVQIVSSKSAELIERIRSTGFGLSGFDLCSPIAGETRKMLLVNTSSKKLPVLRTIISEIDKSAFIVVKETRFVQNGFFRK